MTDAAYANYDFTYTPSAGSHTLKVEFDNDQGPQNLLLDYVTVDEGTAGCTTPTTYEGESMTFTGSGTVASNPGQRYFYSNGNISQSHTFVAGSRTVRVRAAGEPAPDVNGRAIWPHIVVSVNGTAIGNRDVNTPDFRYYSFPFTATSGSQTIQVAYDNDGSGGGQDRNLRVDKIEVLCDGLAIDPGTRSALFPTSWQPGYKSGNYFLQDYSYAGYGYGATPPINTDGQKTVINIATGASVTTINSAIATANTGVDADGYVIKFAAGEYTLSSDLSPIQRPGVVLRGTGSGTGSGATRLRFTTDSATDSASIAFKGSAAASTTSANWGITEVGGEHDRTVRLTSVSGLAVGDEIEIGWTNSTTFRQNHHPGMTASDNAAWPFWTVGANGWVSFFRRRIDHIDTVNNRIVLDIPLRYTFALADGPAVRRVDTSNAAFPTGYITNCGIENLSISNTQNDALLIDQQSVIRFDKAMNCWVHNVTSYAASGWTHHIQSHGVRLESSRLMTISDVTMARSQNRLGGGNGYLFFMARTRTMSSCRGRPAATVDTILPSTTTGSARAASSSTTSSASTRRSTRPPEPRWCRLARTSTTPSRWRTSSTAHASTTAGSARTARTSRPTPATRARRTCSGTTTGKAPTRGASARINSAMATSSVPPTWT